MKGLNMWWNNKTPKIDFIQEMKVLNVKHGDIIVLKMNRVISTDGAKNLRAAIAEVTGLKNKIMLLEDNMDIGVLRRTR